MRSQFIVTERLAFSAWSEDYLPDAIALWGDPDVTRYIVAKRTMSKEEIVERLRNEIEIGNASGMQYWPIYLRTSGDLAGCCGLRPKDAEKGWLEMGVHLKPQYWGQGLAREACLAVVQYAFHDLGAKAVFAGHNPDNLASARLLKGLGFVHTHDELYPPTGLMHPSYLLRPEEFSQIDREKCTR